MSLIVYICCMLDHNHPIIDCTRVLTLHALVALLVSLGLLSDNPGLVCSRYLCLDHGADVVPAGGHRFLDSPWGFILVFHSFIFCIPFLFLWYSTFVLLYLISVISMYLYPDRLVFIFIILLPHSVCSWYPRPRVPTSSISTQRTYPPVAFPYPSGWSVTVYHLWVLSDILRFGFMTLMHY